MIDENENVQQRQIHCSGLLFLISSYFLCELFYWRENLHIILALIYMFFCHKEYIADIKLSC